MKMGFKQLVSEANAAVKTMTVDEAVKAVNAGEVVLIDIREPNELAADGKIPGAEPAPRGMLEFYADPDSPYHKPVFATPGKTLLLYCASAGRSALAAKTLKDMGLENVAHIGGGFKAWVAANNPVEKK
jgi:rhodanese-related sulfurtransferase